MGRSPVRATSETRTSGDSPPLVASKLTDYTLRVNLKSRGAIRFVGYFV